MYLNVNIPRNTSNFFKIIIPIKFKLIKHSKQLMPNNNNNPLQGSDNNLHALPACRGKAEYQTDVFSASSMRF